MWHKDGEKYLATTPKFSLELCNLMRNINKLPLAKEFTYNVRESGKIPPKCPVKPVC
jgi:Protein of unknown function (DUF1091)